MTIGIYLRISLDSTGQRTGVSRQRADCTAIAAARWPDHQTREYTDNDVSAYSGVKRPQYTELLAAITTGELSAVVAYNLDRLLRQPRDLEHLIDLGVPIITAAGDLDLTTHDGQLHARILAAVAKKSSDDASRRITRAARDRSEAGKWVGGRVCYPYQQQLRAVGFRSPLAERVARAAVEMFVDGHSLRTIARTAHQSDDTAPHTPTGWKNVLKSPALAGVNVAGVAGDWPAIVTAVEHAEILARLTDPARSTHTQTRARGYWLTGVVMCGRCDGAMYPQLHQRTKEPAVRCRACGRVVDRGVLDATVREMLYVAAPPSPAPPMLRASPANQDQERLAELAAMYATGDLTRSEWQAARQAAGALASTPQPILADVAQLPLDLRDAWQSLEPHDHHRIARLYLQRVDVAPGGRYDASRVHPVWRE